MEQRRAWYAKNQEYAKSYSRRNYRQRVADPAYRASMNDREKRRKYEARYGITYEEKTAILAAQGNACKICGKTDARWHVDHCHKTSVLRGILCHNCNIMLGVAKDSPETLLAAVIYLRANSVEN